MSAPRFSREDFEADSSSALGLSHSANRVRDPIPDGEIDYSPVPEYEGDRKGRLRDVLDEQLQSVKDAQKAEFKRQNILELQKRHILENPKLTLKEAEERAEADFNRGLHPVSMEGLKPSNPGAYSHIQRRENELAASGVVRIEASQQARSEAESGALEIERPANADRDYIGESIEDSMGTKRRAGSGGGGSRNKHKVEKPGTLTCADSGIECRAPESEKCSCRQCYRWRQRQHGRRGGRPRSDADGTLRSIRRRVRMTDATLETLQRERIEPADGLALLGIALREGRPIDAVITEFRAQRASGSMPDFGCA